MTYAFLRRLTALAALLALPGALAQIPGGGHFFFQWPQTTSQCEVVTLIWNNATPPFSAWILPMGDQPFLYNIPDAAYVNGSGSYDIQLQLDSGTNYIVIMSDVFGLGSGGASEIQQVAGSQRTVCLNTASENQTAPQFSWSVSGQAKQCQTGFDVALSSSTAEAPYNYTVLPLDQGFYPFDVAMPTDGDYDSSWKLNLTAGTRFTIVMNNKNGRGTGGVGGIYQVSNSSSTSCIAASMEPTGSWPVGIATDILPAATIPTASTTVDSFPSGGAIAGIVVGAVAAVILVALLMLFLLRRRRRRGLHAGAAERKSSGQLDLADGAYTEYEDPGLAPMIEPYPEVETFRPPEGRGQEAEALGTSTGVTEHEHDTSSSAGFATLVKYQGRASWAIDNHTPEDPATLTREGENRDGPVVAGPLPAKSPRGSSVARLSILSQQQRSSLAFSSPDAPRWPVELGLGLGNDASRTSGGGMRLVSHDDRDELSAVPPGAVDGRGRCNGVPAEDSLRRTTFRRHHDAGTVDVVDLPPLYTDIQRDQPMCLDPAPGDAGRSPPGPEPEVVEVLD